MISWRTIVWYSKSFFDKYRRTLLLGLGIGILVVWLFPRLVVYIPQPKPTRYVGRVGLFTWVDLPQDIRDKVSVGLTALDESGEPIPVLAERWSVEEEGRVFRFLIKKDLRWQDGKLFVPEDVEYNFGDVQTIRTENEVVFRLTDPYAPFASVVAQPLFREVQERRFGFLTENRIVGLGEYSVLHLKFETGYVRELALESQRERVVYRFYPSEHDAIVAFRHGKVDELEKLATVDEFSEAEVSRLELEEQTNLQQYVALFFNTSDPNLSKEIRQALHYGTHKPDRDPRLLRALSPTSPLSWAYNSTDEINPFSYNREKALELYEKANPQQPLEITLDAAVSLLEEAQIITDDWKALGDAAKQNCEQKKAATLARPARNNQEREAHEAAVVSDCVRFEIHASVRVVQDLQNFQAVLIGREVPADPDQYPWWHSDQPSNISQYQNTRVDKLLEDARTETDQQKRKVMYFEFQRYLVEDVPAMFLWHIPEFTVRRKSIL